MPSTDYKKVLEMDPRHEHAAVAARRLEREIEERNEKLKTEMLGTLPFTFWIGLLRV